MPFFYKDNHNGTLPLAAAKPLTGDAAARWTEIPEAEYRTLCQNCPSEHPYLPPPIVVEPQPAPLPLPAKDQQTAPPTTVPAAIEHQ